MASAPGTITTGPVGGFAAPWSSAGRRADPFWLRVPALLRQGLRRAWASSRVIALILLAAIIVLRIEDVRPLELLRLEAFDTLQRMAPRTLASGAVAIVDVDEASLASHGQWPWSRRTIADLVGRLDAAGARAIGFDILFAEPDRLSPPAYGLHGTDLPDALRAILLSLPDTDNHLATAIEAAPVILGRAMTNDAQVATGPHSDRQTPMAVFGEDPAPFLYTYANLLPNLEVLEQAAHGLGTFTLTPEPDGLVRRVPAILRVGDSVYPSLALEMLRVATGMDYFEVHSNRQGAGVEAISVGNHRIPTDGAGRIWLRYAEPTPEIYLSAGDVLNGTVAPEAVAGKLVIVGTSATGLRDLRATPLSESVAGVEIHAQLIDSVLARDVLSQPPYALGLELCLALAAGALLILLVPRTGAGVSLVALLCAIGIVWTISVYGFFELSHLIDATLPTLAAGAVFAFLAYANYVREERKRREIRTAFGQYLSPGLVQQLEDDPDRLRLGGETRELTFLFTDLAGFTAMVEGSEPTRLVAALNAYLNGLCEIVIRHGGTIDKIVGDAVHAMFGAPVDLPDHAGRAVRCARDIDRFGQAFREGSDAQGLAFGVTRIGVNTGAVVVGNFGGARRLDYTAHGDAINMTARLEQANKLLGTRVCVAKSTVEQTVGIAFRPLGTLLLRGKKQDVEVYEPVQPGAGEDRLADYAHAFSLLSRGDPSARGAFEELAAGAPDDPVVAMHLRRILEGQVGTELGRQGE